MRKRSAYWQQSKGERNMKHYQSPEWEIRQLPFLAILTASGDKEDWETDIVPDEEDVDPEDQ